MLVMCPASRAAATGSSRVLGDLWQQFNSGGGQPAAAK
jgi:hypothetical protein